MQWHEGQGWGGQAVGLWYLIESCDAGEDDVGVLYLDDTLAQPHQVRADPNGTTGHLGTHTQGHMGFLGRKGCSRVREHQEDNAPWLCRSYTRSLLASCYSPQGDLKSK